MPDPVHPEDHQRGTQAFHDVLADPSRPRSVEVRARHGDGPGTRALIEVLLLHRRMPPAQVIAGIRAALAAGSCSADVVAVEARKHLAAAPGQDGAAWPALEGPRRSRAAVVTLPQRPDALPPDRRPAPSVAAYDQLLSVPPASRGGA